MTDDQSDILAAAKFVVTDDCQVGHVTTVSVIQQVPSSSLVIRKQCWENYKEHLEWAT